MRGPKPRVVELRAEERQGLEALVRAHRTPQQLALRARIVLAAADGLNTPRLRGNWESRMTRCGCGGCAGWDSRQRVWRI